MRLGVVAVAGLLTLPFFGVLAGAAPTAHPSLLWPVCSGMAGPYGFRTDQFTGRQAFHSGIDLAGAYGDIVHAAGGGRVISAEMRGPYGLAVETDAGNGMKLRYGHMSALLVREGEMVRPGQAIGQIGQTGRATAPHLHFEVWIGDVVRNPLNYLDRRAGCITPWPDFNETGARQPTQQDGQQH